MLTPNMRDWRILSCMRALRPTETSTRGGCSEPDMKAFAVIACASPSSSVEMTTTPVANWPMASRNWRASNALRAAASCSVMERESIGGMAALVAAYDGSARSAQAPLDEADVVRVDQVGDGPAVEVVLVHRRLGKGLEAVEVPFTLRGPQVGQASDVVAADVVDLVELVASAELGADGVPQHLHDLDPLHRGHAARAAHVLVEVAADLGRLEVGGVRVQVDQAGGDDLLDDVLDFRHRLLVEHAVGTGEMGIGTHNVVPGHRALGHGVGKRPERVAPSDDLAELGLHAVETLGAGDLQGARQEAADEVHLDREARAPVHRGALEKARADVELVGLLEVAVHEHVF